MSKRELLVKSVLGEAVYEALSKAIVKQATSSVVDITELHDALKIVPKSVMAFILSMTKDMDKNQTKEESLPWEDNAMINITKSDEDVYKGYFVKDGKKAHEFDLCSIPQLAAHMLSFSELYEDAMDDHEESSVEESSSFEESSVAVQEVTKEATKASSVEDKIKDLEKKLDSLILLIANNGLQKTEPKDIIKKLKKAGLAPKMPSPPSPGVKVGGMQGITMGGIHGDKTAATDSKAKPISAVKNPSLKVPAAGKAALAQPKQPKTATKSEPRIPKSLTFTKNELNSTCSDCGMMAGSCACFRVLSKPEIVKTSGDNVTLKFKGDWDAEAVTALFKSIKGGSRGSRQ